MLLRGNGYTDLTFPKGQVMDSMEPSAHPETRLKGVPLSPGLALGRICRIRAIPFERTGTSPEGTVPDQEARFSEAREKALEALRGLEEATRQTLGPDKAAIFQAHQWMVQDPLLVDGVTAAIRTGQTAEDGVVETTLSLKAQFEALADPYFRERAADILDVGQRLHRILTGSEDLSRLPEEDCLLAVEELSPSDAALLATKKGVRGVLTSEGGPTSHFAILLKSMELPGISGLALEENLFEPGRTALCDGETGEVVLFPEPETRHRFEERLAHQERIRIKLKEVQGHPSQTRDGHPVGLWGNIAAPGEGTKVRESGGTGVGLFRTEFLFMGRTTPPDEEEQFQAYRQALEALAPFPVTIRTLDAGGDKEVPYVKGLVGEEANPFLGLRALRVCLQHQDLFRTQLRALARASAHGNLKVMLPMVSSLWEIRQARTLLEESILECRDQGHPTADRIPLGIMVEIPSAALMADRLAREVDFFSVGTNDLIQYTLAVDRQNPRLLSWYEPFHPAVLRLLALTAQGARAAGVEVGMCGEMAGDRLALPLLVALGYDDLSMSPARIPWVQETLGRLDRPSCQALWEEVSGMDSGTAIRDRLATFLESLGD